MPQSAPSLPNAFEEVEHLEDIMTTPNPQVVVDFGGLDGDLIILGVGGKIGPTLARLAKRAAPDKRIIGVARFSDKGLRKKLAGWGVECLEADPLDRKQIEGVAEARQCDLHGGTQVRLDGCRGPDLGDERLCAGNGR